MNAADRAAAALHQPHKPSLIARLIEGQVWLSRKFDRMLPEDFRLGGKHDFIHAFAPQFLKENQTIYDVGGGKSPCLSPEMKQRLRAKVICLDVDGDEMQKAPAAAYDELVCADLTEYQGNADADVVICQTVLEHVKDTPKALAAISSMLKPGGLALIFVPSRNALYARLNALLPQGLTTRLLRTVFPHDWRKRGFRAYYHKCTPHELRLLAAEHNLIVIDERFYFQSSYFAIFFPAHLLWRLWLMAFRLFRGQEAAETFSLALRKGNA